MNFLDGALFPENQEKLVITAAPYGPEWPAYFALESRREIGPFCPGTIRP
jgi:hypothetical protein